MGQIKIDTWGSFPGRTKVFGAMEHGHAHAVAEAIAWLSDEVLPEAIERDHKLHAEGAAPSLGFGRPPRKHVDPTITKYIHDAKEGT